MRTGIHVCYRDAIVNSSEKATLETPLNDFEHGQNHLALNTTKMAHQKADSDTFVKKR